MCGIGLKDWSSDDEPLFEHVRHSPDCQFLYTFLGQDVLDAFKVCSLNLSVKPEIQSFVEKKVSQIIIELL